MEVVIDGEVYDSEDVSVSVRIKVGELRQMVEAHSGADEDNRIMATYVPGAVPEKDSEEVAMYHIQCLVVHDLLRNRGNKKLN